MILRTMMASAIVAAAVVSAPALAAGTITSGTYTVGIGNNGELFDYTSYIGFRRDADNTDPLSPGTPRDSWGVTTSLGSAYADQSAFGSAGITGTAFGAFGGASTTSLSTTTVGVNVAQTYSFVAANIIRVTHVVTNTSGVSLSAIFQRDWDTDPQPTFYNNSFDSGAKPGYVIDSSYYGFENPDPSVAYNFSCFAGCNADSDLGGGIKIDLGILAPGASSTFYYYYGISQVGQTINGLITQANGLGASYLIASQSDENGVYPNLGINSQFIGVGGVPEPATWALMLGGFAMIGAAARRRNRALAA